MHTVLEQKHHTVKRTTGGHQKPCQMCVPLQTDDPLGTRQGDDARTDSIDTHRGLEIDPKRSVHDLTHPTDSLTLRYRGLKPLKRSVLEPY